MVRSTLLAFAVALGALSAAQAQNTFFNERTHARLTLSDTAYQIETRTWLPDGSVGYTTDRGKVTRVQDAVCLWGQDGPPNCSGGADQEVRSWFGDQWYRQRPLQGMYRRADGLVLDLRSNGALLIPLLHFDGEWWSRRDTLCIAMKTTGTLCERVVDNGSKVQWGQWSFTRQ